MIQDSVKVLRQRRLLLEAQIRGCQFSFPILEANRLNIRTGLPAAYIQNFWNSSREILNKETRTLSALASEYYLVQVKLDKLDQVHPDGK